ncbi:MAG TPA: biotin--[acetyl-CoA-carboxylase] ligase [Pyrinomonadaceae bacterium]|nr:biotin--[acetyl-CoA-carboxylase] ligase [Pyrinomonadaceae bacterium]
MQVTIKTFDSLGSTNTEALEMARGGADEGVCVIARRQTAGRGRHGRKWVSERDAGLAFSIILRPALPPESLPLITLMAGVAVHETLTEFGLVLDIKWVNDVLIDEKKISGILAETTMTDKGLAVILGIGINIRSSNFPPELADRATSIEDSFDDPERVPTPERLTAILTGHLSRLYEKLLAPGGPETILGDWRERSSYFAGKRVTVRAFDQTLIGTTDGLEPSGALRLRKDDGEIVIIQAGDVEQLRADPGSL